MFKALLVGIWALFAIDAFTVAVSIVSRNTGSDAAGRGVALTFGLAALVFLLAGGTALYFAGRAHSWWGAAGSFLLLALPPLLFFGTDIEEAFHKAGNRIADRKIGRYSEPAQRELAKAIETSDLAAMRRILATHPNLQAHDEAGYDLLGFAASRAQSLFLDSAQEPRLDAVRLLLEAGADPNAACDSDGNSVYFPLARSSDPVPIRIFGMFLDHGANPNYVTSRGEPIIFETPRNLETLRALVEHGANLEIHNAEADTPLLWFVGNGWWDGAMLLLERGAGVGVKNSQGATLETGLHNQENLAARLHESLPEGYHRVKAEIARRRAAPPR